MYVIGGPIDDARDFYGREALIRQLFDSPSPVFVVGWYRSGKTSLLKAMARQAPERGMAPLFVPLHGDFQSFSDIRELLALQVEHMSWNLSVDDSVLDEDRLDEASVPELFKLAHRVARKVGVELLVLLDEIDVLVRFMERERRELARFRQWLLGGGLGGVVLTGPRRARQLDESGKARIVEPFLSGFNTVLLEPGLDPRAARALLRLEKRGHVGVDPDEPQFSEIYRKTGGMAYLLQAAGDGLLKGVNVEAVLEEILQGRAGHVGSMAFDQNLNMTSPSEREVLERVAGGRPLEAQLAPFATSLEKSGYLDGEGRAVIPLMLEYLQLKGGWDSFPSLLADELVAPGCKPDQPSTEGGLGSTPAGAGASATVGYRILEYLGGGSFGEVYKALLSDEGGLQRVVALKVLRRKWVQMEGVARRMRDEARILARLGHPVIVRVEQLCRIGRLPSVVMEYVEGVDLSELLEPRAGLPALPVRVAAEVVADVASALHSAYNEPPQVGDEAIFVTHRDIKPSNIRVTRHGQVKILDFGLAFAEFDRRETESRVMVMGTPRYLPPERRREWGVPENRLPASDVFALGLVLIELVTGQVPDWPGLDREAYERELERLLNAFPPSHARLRELARDMACWEHERRPAAQEVYRRAWTVVRGTSGMGIREWAEEAVPRVLEQRPTDDRESLLRQARLEREGRLELPWTTGVSGPEPTGNRASRVLAVRRAGRGMGWQIEVWQGARSELYQPAEPHRKDDLGDWALRVLPAVRADWVEAGHLDRLDLQAVIGEMERRLRTRFRAWLEAGEAEGDLGLVTDLPELPWELLRLGPDPQRFHIESFLGCRCAVGRQFVPAGSQYGSFAARSLEESVHRALLFHDGGRQQRAEVNAIAGRLRERGVDAGIFALGEEEAAMRSWCEEGVDLLHVACQAEDGVSWTSEVLEAAPAAAASAVPLGGSVLLERITTLDPVMVFFNACSSLVGVGSKDASEVGNPTARRALERSPVVVGTLWPVDAEAARRMAELFYDHLIQGRSLGRAMAASRRDLHRQVVSDDWQSWAAYVVYGDPAGCVVFGRSEESDGNGS